jgi:hypothetical protein
MALPISCAESFKPNLRAESKRPPVKLPNSSKLAKFVSNSSSTLIDASLPANLEPLS